MSTITYLTQEGYDKVKTELDHLKTTGRQEMAKAIAEAREKGDLSENAEYHAAKEAQGMMEMKINEMEKSIAHVRIMDSSSVDTSEVRLLTNVTIRNTKNGKQETYKLVSETEASLKERKLSIGSPIGKGLLGKKIGDVAQVSTPAGQVEFEVLDISA